MVKETLDPKALGRATLARQLLLTRHPMPVCDAVEHLVGLQAQSVLLARWQKCPALLFSVPGLVPLVPGAPAYMAVRSLLDGNLPQAQQEVQRVAIVTASIALGVLLSTMFQEAMVKHLRRIHVREEKE